MSLNVVSVILNEILDLLYDTIDNEFPWRSYTKEKLFHEFSRLCKIVKKEVRLPIKRSYIGYLCSNYFFQKERLNTPGNSGKKLSTIDYWNTNQGKKIIISCAKKNNRDIFNSAVFISRAPAQFSPVAAACIYKYFDAKHVLDPYAGWGDRCLAAMALGIKYTGIDSNPNLQDPFSRMIEQFSSGDKINIINDKTENVDLESISYDLIVSSPPFWKNGYQVECYMNCIDDYKYFLANSLIPLIRKGLSKRVKICLHLPQQMYQDLVEVFKKPSLVININKTTQTKNNKDMVYCWG